jgi:hypothetical protein
MTGNLPAWPDSPDPSAPAEDAGGHDDQEGGQLAAARHVLDWFRAMPWLSIPAPEPRPLDELPPPAPSRSASSRDPKTGRYRQAPEVPPVPEVDHVLTLADASRATGMTSTRTSRTTGRDVTGETMRSARPAPRPAESAHVLEMAFPARTITCDDPRRWRRAWRRAQGQ